MEGVERLENASPDTIGTPQTLVEDSTLVSARLQVKHEVCGGDPQHAMVLIFRHQTNLLDCAEFEEKEIINEFSFWPAIPV